MLAGLGTPRRAWGSLEGPWLSWGSPQDHLSCPGDPLVGPVDPQEDIGCLGDTPGGPRGTLGTPHILRTPKQTLQTP